MRACVCVCLCKEDMKGCVVLVKAVAANSGHVHVYDDLIVLYASVDHALLYNVYMLYL